MNKFKNALQKMTWHDVISSKQVNFAYEVFLNKFIFLYDKVSEIYVVTVKLKTLKNLKLTQLSNLQKKEKPV